MRIRNLTFIRDVVLQTILGFTLGLVDLTWKDFLDRALHHEFLLVM